MKITPAILTDSFLLLQHEVDAVRYSSVIEAVHIDVIDGQFADNITVTPLDLTVAEFEPLKIDFHFMTEEPMDFVYECEALKEYLPIRRMIGQVERMTHQADFLWSAKSNGWEATLALDLFTPLEAIDEELWKELDSVLLLGVEAGYQDQKLHANLYRKLQELAKRFPRKNGYNFKVLVDGGIKLDNILTLARYDIDECVVGSAIWESEDPLLAIEELYQSR